VPAPNSSAATSAMPVGSKPVKASEEPCAIAAATIGPDATGAEGSIGGAGGAGGGGTTGTGLTTTAAWAVMVGSVLTVEVLIWAVLVAVPVAVRAR